MNMCDNEIMKEYLTDSIGTTMEEFLVTLDMFSEENMELVMNKLNSGITDTAKLILEIQ